MPDEPNKEESPWLEYAPGRFRWVGRGEQRKKKAEINQDYALTAWSMGCVDPVEQQKRLKDFSNMGIRAKYNTDTGELIFHGGRRAQMRLAKYHGMTEIR